MSLFTEKRRLWVLLFLMGLTFFSLLGSRALNEPDEGRYAEVAREMIDTGNWLVPHLWYLPHLDKPPMTYWLVAVSMKLFGQNEWAVRLPLALAGVSGVWATYLLGRAIHGPRTGWWSAVILQSCLLYFALARMLTTDMFLTLFTAWSFYFFWRSWQCLMQSETGPRTKGFMGWHLAGWTMLAPAFLTKGPIALAMPLAGFGALAFYRRREMPGVKVWLPAVLTGLALFLALTLPWFWWVFQREPAAANYMILGQAAGHLLGTTIKNRPGSPFYFFGILAVGLLPWTCLLGWLWRRQHWRGLTPARRDAWLLLNVWAIFTFTLFSLSHSKLPAYILPLFPALAILLAWRFLSDDQAEQAAPKLAWRLAPVSALLVPVLMPFIFGLAFAVVLPAWMRWQALSVAAVAGLIFWFTRNFSRQNLALLSAGLALPGLLLVASEIGEFQTHLRANQTLQPLGQALCDHYQPGDTVVCWGKFPQGLPFYAGGAISGTRSPYLGAVDLNEAPFRYPGNIERLGSRFIPDKDALKTFLQTRQHIWLVGFGTTLREFQSTNPGVVLHSVFRSGQWELYSN